ncbi:MAG: hypothetical protein JW788_01860 [Candidatus Omnitrophica bacterium]|nr:hypothetical protein [Candidatus Omnitrophota bacterium]
MSKKLCVAIFCLFVWGVMPCFCYGNGAVVVIKNREIPLYDKVVRSFRARLERNGVSAAFEEYNLEEKGESILREIRAKTPVLILNLGTSSAKSAQTALKGFPMVFTMILNPWQNNIFPPGVCMDISFETKLEDVKKIITGMETVGTIYSQDSLSKYEELAQACNKFGLRLAAKRINDQKDFPQALEDISSQVDLFIMLADPGIYHPKTVEYLLNFSLQKGFSVMGLSSGYTKAGALISYDCDYEDLGVQAAELVLKVLAKDPLAAGEIVRPRKVKTTLNLKVAQRLGLKIPQNILNEAEEVFGR